MMKFLERGAMGFAAVLLAIASTSQAAPLEVCPTAREPMRDGRQSTVYVHGHDDWLFRRDQDLLVKYTWETSGVALLSRLQADLAARGTTLVIARMPPRGVAHPEQVDPNAPGAEGFDPAAARKNYLDHANRLRSLGIAVPDMLTAFDAAKDAQGPAFRARDHHWRPEGAALAADAIAATIRELPGGDRLPAAAFERKDLGTTTARGALLMKVETLCGAQSIDDETIVLGKSVPAAGAVDAAALFGDPPPPEVVVVGASNTNKGGMDRFYFAGALRESLGADVLNVGVDGGGLFPPLLAYLASPAFQEHPPRFLVWVSGAHLRLDHSHRLREVVPRISTDCGAPIAQTTATVDRPDLRESVVLMDVPDGVQGDGWTLQIAPSEPALLHYDLLLLHADGHSERVGVRRSPRLGVELPAQVLVSPHGAPLQRVSLSSKGPWKGEVRVAVCKNGVVP